MDPWCAVADSVPPQVSHSAHGAMRARGLAIAEPVLRLPASGTTRTWHVTRLGPHACRKARHAVKTTFLPAGYPHTVGEGYVQYCAWNGLTNFSITANAGVMRSGRSLAPVAG